MMQNRTKRRIGVPEILAPAGSMESLKAAVAAGCDAVYMGGSKFGARAYAQNPEEDENEEAFTEAAEEEPDTFEEDFEEFSGEE